MYSTPDSSTPILIVDLVSKFLNKLFEKDSKSAQYLKHWDSFRPLLSATPLELTPAYNFINNLIVDTSDSYGSFTGGKSGAPGIQVHQPKDNYSFQFLAALETNSLNNSFEVHAQPDEKNKRRHSLFDPKTHLNLSPGSTDLRKIISQRPSQFSQRSFQDSPDGIMATKDLLSDLTHEDSFEYGRSFDSPTYNFKDEHSPAFKNNLTLLKDLARKMKDNVAKHTDSLDESMHKVKQQKFLMEERSPLRKLKVYGTNDTAGSYGQTSQPASYYANQELGNDYIQKYKLY